MASTTSMYDHYYTAADVVVDLYCPATQKRVNLDTTVSIAYTHNISTVPVYTLGNLEPYFFSKGNSLVQGQLDIAFKSTEYMRIVIDEIVTASTGLQVFQNGIREDDEGKLYASASVIETNIGKTVEEMDKISTEQLKKISNTMSVQGKTLKEKSLVNVPFLLDIIIIFNNSNSNMMGVQSIVTLKGVKFTAQSLALSSHDDTAIVERFGFMARNIK